MELIAGMSALNNTQGNDAVVTIHEIVNLVYGCMIPWVVGDPKY